MLVGGCGADADGERQQADRCSRDAAPTENSVALVKKGLTPLASGLQAGHDSVRWRGQEGGEGWACWWQSGCFSTDCWLLGLRGPPGCPPHRHERPNGSAGALRRGRAIPGIVVEPPRRSTAGVQETRRAPLTGALRCGPANTDLARTPYGRTCRCLPCAPMGSGVIVAGRRSCCWRPSLQGSSREPRPHRPPLQSTSGWAMAGGVVPLPFVAAGEAAAVYWFSVNRRTPCH